MMNPIINDLNARASFDWPDEQKAYFVQIAADAKPVDCVRMRDALTPEQMKWVRLMGYHTHQKQCYRNASDLVRILGMAADEWDLTVKYVEGFAYSCGLLSIEHAFVKVNDKYIDPTFERALKLDVRFEHYVSCLELDKETLNRYQFETGYYGELYRYDYALRHRPELAARIRQINPHNR